MQTLVAVEDAYIQLSVPDTNFGNSTQMSLKFSDPDGFSRKIYLKFDISGIEGDLKEAALVMDLLVRSPGDYALSPKTYVLGPGLGDSWDQGTLTWNNAPAGSGLPGDSLDPALSTQVDWLAALTSDIDASGPLSWDIGFVLASGQSLVDAISQARANGEDFLTLVTTRTDTSGGNTVWASMEVGSLLGPRLLFVSRNPADFNDDGIVNNEDFVAWQNGFGMTNGAGFIDGDADKDGDVDGSDFLMWQANYGNGVGTLASAQAVPEPCGLALHIIGVAFLLVHRCLFSRL